MKSPETLARIKATLDRATEIARSSQALPPSKQQKAREADLRELRKLLRKLVAMKASAQDRLAWRAAAKALDPVAPVEELPEAKPRRVRLILAGAFEMGRRRH